MKKLMFIFLFVLFASNEGSGQEFSIGIKPSFLIIGTKYTEEPKIFNLKMSSRCSYAFGITVSDQINKLFGIKIEPRLIAKGYNVHDDPSFDISYRHNYISMPALFYISPIQNLNFELGPEICYLINSKIKFSDSNAAPNSNGNSFETYESRDLKPVELSILSGITYHFFKRFDLGFRYGIGLTPTQKGQLRVIDWTGPPFNYKYMSRYFELNLNTRIFSKVNK
jgi:hypothetical protein